MSQQSTLGRKMLDGEMPVPGALTRSLAPGPEGQVRSGRARRLGDYYRLIKPGIVYSNVFGTAAGLWLAKGSGAFNDRSPLLIVGTLIGVALVIASGTVINNVIDRDIDQLMERTKNRPIPGGWVSPTAALVYGLLLGLLGEGLLYALVHPLAAYTVFVGWAFYVVFYTLWTKRTTTLNTIVGAVSGAIPTVAGYVAYSMRVDLVAWVLFAILFLWQPAHFLALAMRRRDDYARAGVPMLPVVYGNGAAKRQTFIYVLTLVPTTLLLYPLGTVGPMYAVGALLLGIVYLALSVRGFRLRGAEERRWSTQMFGYSIVYLTILYGLMIFA
ncbi:MAG: protoheme IX farnesyltransferase [Hydrogenibacillus sp.]|nr:protoheme IX farnesyltransferase [Hydrogenibacillus sp.]